MALQVEHTAGFLFFWMFFLVGMVIPSLIGNPYDGYVHPIGGVTYQFSTVSFSQTYSVDCRCMVSTPQSQFIGVSTCVQSKYVMKILEWSENSLVSRNYLLEGSSQLPPKTVGLVGYPCFLKASTPPPPKSIQ